MNAEFDGIRLRGSQSFVDSTREALSLLKSTSHYEPTIRPNLGIIQHHPVRWFHLIKNTNFAEAPWRGDKQLVQVFADVATASPLEYARILAHEAFHHFIYFEFMRFGNRESWNWHRWFRRHRDEIRCREFELAVAKELEFDQDQLEFLEVSLFIVPHWDLPRRQLASLDHRRRRLKIARDK